MDIFDQRGTNTSGFDCYRNSRFIRKGILNFRLFEPLPISQLLHVDLLRVP